MKTILPYGCWPSSVSAEMVSQQGVNPREIILDEECVYWLESRPEENGRSTIMRCNNQGVVDSVLAAPFDCRSRVHEYGGGSYTVHKQSIYFCNANDNDNQIYVINLKEEGAPQQLTHYENYRFAALTIDPHHHRLIAVCEVHTMPSTPKNCVIYLPLLKADHIDVLLAGEDFYSTPLVSPCGTKLCWLSWSHPHMPWQSSQLWLTNLTDKGEPLTPQLISGGDNESICQPRWSPNGELHFISDRNGWWNLYRWRDASIQPLWAKQADFAVPQWVFGQSNYDFISEQLIVCSYCQQGFWQLSTLHTETGEQQSIVNDYVNFSSIKVHNQAGYVIASSKTIAPHIVKLNIENLQLTALQLTTSQQAPDLMSVSTAIAMQFDSADGSHCYGLYYPPLNSAYIAPENELPPLFVIVHGGPTGFSGATYDPMIQFWTNRGFAVLAVNYRGSANYGRDYRQSLLGQWGIADAEDCVAAAQQMVDKKLVDGSRLIIRGSSAGGLTVLSALTFHTQFATGASYYGISDLELLAQQTHKFESHYMQSLIGPYPEEQHLYQQRSAINHVNSLHKPIIFFQGLKDKVVPPNQTRVMVTALREKNIPTAEILFDDERHGFRQSNNIATALNAELHFYAQVLGIKVADSIDNQLAKKLPYTTN
jgi:dipeptidyl aminopeptidase/acylaminoacyl peptidase